jgi:hypothetical protein
MTRVIGKKENEKEIVDFCTSCNTIFTYTEEDYIKTGPFECALICPVCGELIQEFLDLD